ncbi:hypothetical protein F3Y22_tig00117000pilonHSYRG00193 [Hibiscus syriacus]|uniref:Pentatricopeptide repeat-containing protein n=1 Tax=Hibiscus syriacus TaxID=106335 RepID=A0A6A2XJA2_HIBSY|nr:hypothetical protein F3Y22_tig00117000pilonHSYRG00193 [Hibiscus syriacus]
MGLKVKAFSNLILMLRSGFVPNEIDITSMLIACDSSGWSVQKGQRLFHSTHTYGLHSRAVDILGRARQLDKTMCVVKQMPPCRRNGVIFGALLAACILHG